ncbi:MAG TPA: hypothetical protein VHN99_03860, partial [Deinococcales bacterium]|nr:hypothetical protein [Deinococcales bacterium]
MKRIVEAHELPANALLLDARGPESRFRHPLPDAVPVNVHGVHRATVTPEDREALLSAARELFAGLDPARPL